MELSKQEIELPKKEIELFLLPPSIQSKTYFTKYSPFLARTPKPVSKTFFLKQDMELYLLLIDLQSEHIFYKIFPNFTRDFKQFYKIGYGIFFPNY